MHPSPAHAPPARATPCPGPPGFDVWMANTRGNTYSRGNRNYRDTEPGYWAHSIDELALVDLPAQIDFILGLTQQRSLAFVGHSQGCTLPLMLLSAKPEYNDKLWLMMLLGAVTHAGGLPWGRGAKGGHGARRTRRARSEAADLTARTPPRRSHAELIKAPYLSAAARTGSPAVGAPAGAARTRQSARRGAARRAGVRPARPQQGHALACRIFPVSPAP
jgi:hypothetical protein